MRLGIDFGTTRTVVAASDRGNYPVVGFLDERGDPVDWFPSVVAERDGELRFGFAAEALASDPAWTVVRSFKRLLSGPDASAERSVQIGSTRLAAVELVARFLGALRTAVRERSNAPAQLAAADDRMQAVIAVPANAHSTQRFVTLDAFRRAGFEVLALHNEPSAAGFEYTHRYRNTLSAKREHIVVYDLGGGTFDASLVRLAGRHHDALATAGVNQLGGDDFDEVLAELALAATGRRRAELSTGEWRRLTDRCREAKEALGANSRRVVVDLDGADVTLSAAEYYEACAPLIERTLEAMAPVLERVEDELAGVYVVGGASALPAVGRVLRERFGRRVHRSSYPFAAIAMGLAISADEGAGFELSDRFSRNFGVFREARGGRDIAFDLIFSRDAELPSGAPLELTRVYRAAHNVGHFRFVECGGVDGGGAPAGDLTPFGEVQFAFDPALRGAELDGVDIRRVGEGPLIREQYSVDSFGIVGVTITDLDSGYERSFRLGAAGAGAGG